MATAGMPPSLTETATRYLESIYYLEHEDEVARPGRLAEWLGVTAPTVTVSLQRLARDGWVFLQPDRSIRLTAAGREAAAHVVRRHRIIERWLTDVLGLDWATADSEAALLAHGMSEQVVERLDRHLGRPATCPHGNVIPGRTPARGRRPGRLSELPSGRRSRVVRISEVAEHEAPQLLSTLDAQGVVPGAEVVVLERDGAGDRLEVGGRVAVLPASMAASVWVEEPETELALDTPAPRALA